jgi:hypothetical protein
MTDGPLTIFALFVLIGVLSVLVAYEVFSFVSGALGGL